MGNDFIPLDAAARRSGLHPNTLRRLLRQGEIFGYKETEGRVTRWLVSVSSLEQYTDPICDSTAKRVANPPQNGKGLI